MSETTRELCKTIVKLAESVREQCELDPGEELSDGQRRALERFSGALGELMGASTQVQMAFGFHMPEQERPS